MQKDKKLEITKEKLLQATAELMEEAKDPMEVTSRQIASRTDVKPSMINYCFGSRESLLHQVFHRKYEAFLKEQGVEEILAADLSPKETLKRLHFIVIKSLLSNYKLTKAITSHVLFRRDLGEESFSYPFVVRHYGGRKSDMECRLIAYELSTMMQLIVYRKDDIKRDFGLDLENDEELQKFLDMRFDLLMREI